MVRCSNVNQRREVDRDGPTFKYEVHPSQNRDLHLHPCVSKRDLRTENQGLCC